ncbi:tellurite resistance domain protein [Pantoea sp. MQR6]|uniref:tellurite resistance domain protein n=1 Tax=Pantoea sp. MQR6 TaxID=2907307 RepID=UPI001FAABE70|nr:tellurite resistance domain protein [Pantoea sp. MQR6]
MQRLTRSALIDDSTLAIYEETVAIIHRCLPTSLALLYATTRRNAEGNLEWWTARQGLATPLSALSDAEQIEIQRKRQQYQDTIAGLIGQLTAREESKAAQALQTLLTHSQALDCYGVSGEPVLINWAIPEQTPLTEVVSTPRQRRFLPWLLLGLLLLLLTFVGWWFRASSLPDAALPAQSKTPAAVKDAWPKKTLLTQDNPSVNLAKRNDFGRIKVNLAWQQGQNEQPVDLDIAAFVKLKNGRNSGVEALSKYSGDYEKAPFMLLQKDLRDAGNKDGEWLFINGGQWQEIDEVLIYSFIYGGANNWKGLDATITLSVPNQPPISSTLINSGERNDVAAIARLKNVDGDIKVERLNSFFPNRESLAKHYGWNFEWTPGASKN